MDYPVALVLAALLSCTWYLAPSQVPPSLPLSPSLPVPQLFLHLIVAW